VKKIAGSEREKTPGASSFHLAERQEMGRASNNIHSRRDARLSERATAWGCAPALGFAASRRNPDCSFPSTDNRLTLILDLA